VSQPEEVTGGTNGGIRREGRTILAKPVELTLRVAARKKRTRNPGGLERILAWFRSPRNAKFDCQTMDTDNVKTRHRTTTDSNNSNLKG